MADKVVNDYETYRASTVTVTDHRLGVNEALPDKQIISLFTGQTDVPPEIESRQLEVNYLRKKKKKQI